VVVYLTVLVLQLISIFVFCVFGVVFFFFYSVIVLARVLYCTCAYVPVLTRVRDCTSVPVLARVCDLYLHQYLFVCATVLLYLYSSMFAVVLILVLMYIYTHVFQVTVPVSYM
jgi:hypothetical protein